MIEDNKELSMENQNSNSIKSISNKFNKDDIVLCSLRDLGSYKAIKEVDIIFKYTLDDYNKLVNMGEIKSLLDIDNEDCGIDFTDDVETPNIGDNVDTQLDDFKFEDI